MRRVLQLTALAVTALALLATSVPRDLSCSEGSLVPGPVRLQVDTTCGPPGVVTVTLAPHPDCRATLDGAAAVGLPSRGWLDGAKLSLEDDGSRHCQCDEGAAGEWAVRCYEPHDADALGCGGSDLPACRGAMRVVAP